MKRGLLVSLLFASFPCFTHAQEDANEKIRNLQLFSVLDGKRTTIPDPNNKLFISNLLTNNQVVKDLGIQNAQESLKKVAEETGGTLGISTVSYEGDVRNEDYSARQILHAKNLVRQSSVLDEVLTPAQWKRLQQIVYQIEIYRAGIGKALTAGHLGRNAEIHENQKTFLLQKCEGIEREAAKAIVIATQELQNSLLELLDKEQRQVVSGRLGPAFFFNDDQPRARYSRDPIDLVIASRVSIDPEDSIAKSRLLTNASVALELGGEEKFEQIRLLIETPGNALSRNPFPRRPFEPPSEHKARKVAAEKEALAAIDESFSPSQLERLRQVAYQVETHRLGFVRALTSGHLGKGIKLDEATRLKLEESFRTLDEKRIAKEGEIVFRAYEAALNELSPQQRAKVRELVGAPFVFAE